MRNAEFPTIAELSTWERLTDEQFSRECEWESGSAPWGTEDQDHEWRVRRGSTGAVAEVALVLHGSDDISLHYLTEDLGWIEYDEPTEAQRTAMTEINRHMADAASAIEAAVELAKRARIDLSVRKELPLWEVDEGGKAWISSQGSCW